MKREAPTPKQTRTVWETLKERRRIHKLSNADLVQECLATSAADSAIVVEMMNRLDLGWDERES